MIHVAIGTCLVLLLCGSFACPLPGQEPQIQPASKPVSDLLKFWDEEWNVHRFGHDYTRAIEYFEKLIAEDPANPFGYLSLAVMYAAKLVDLPNYEDEVRFYDAVEKAITQSEAAVQANENDAGARFYLGGSLGYKAIYDGMTGRWWSAFWTGRRGVDELSKTVALDSTLYDAYYGLGLFDYWQARKSQIFWWLPFMGDNRQRGINNLKVAIRNGTFTQAESQAALVYIHIEEQEFDKAIPLAEELYRRFSYSRFFKRCVADSYLRGGRPQEAEPLYQSLLDDIRKDPNATRWNTVLHRLNVAKAQYLAGEYVRAELNLAAIVADGEPPDKKQRDMEMFKRYYASAKDYLKNVREKLAEQSQRGGR